MSPVGLNLTEAQKHRHLIDASRLAYQRALQLGAELIHDHTDYAPKRGYPLPIVRTIHGPATVAAVANYRSMTQRGDHFVAISQRQRDLFAAAAKERFSPDERINFAGVVYNPIDVAAAPVLSGGSEAWLCGFPGPLPLGEEPGWSDPRGAGGGRAADDGAAGHDRGTILL